MKALFIAATLGGALALRAGELPDREVLKQLRSQVETDYLGNPSRAKAGAEKALALLGEGGSLEDRLWFLGELSKDLAALADFQGALDVARRGLTLAGPQAPALSRVKFGILVARAQRGLGQSREGWVEMLPWTPLLPDLEASPDPESRRQAAQGYLTIGNAHLLLSRIPEAMEACTRGLRLYDQLGDRAGQAMAEDSIAWVHYQAGRPQESRDASLRALERAKGLPNGSLLAGLHIRLSNTYGILGELDKELAEIQAARKLALQAGHLPSALVASVNLADVALRKKDYPAALRYAEDAQTFADRMKDATNRAVSWVNKGIAMNHLGRPGGIEWIQRGLDDFTARGFTSYQVEIAGVLAEELAFLGDYEKAYQAFRRFKELNDGLLRKADLKRVDELNAAYQNEKKQREIESLQRDRLVHARLRNLSILAGVLGLSAALILVLSRRKLQRANQALEEMALHDPLTGLANRRYLATRIGEDLAQINRLYRNALAAGADPGSPHLDNLDAVFFMLDIDHFKRVNDEHGHAAGDAVLRQFARILLSILRESDTVVRWGGEEFLVVAKHASRKEAHLVADRILASIRDHPFDLGNGTCIRKTCSLGFTCYPFAAGRQPEVPWETLVDMADQCLYAAKSGGRDSWVGLYFDKGPETASFLPAHGQVDVARCVADGRITAKCSGGGTPEWPPLPGGSP